MDLAQLDSKHCINNEAHNWVLENDGWYFTLSQCSVCGGFLEESADEIRFFMPPQLDSLG